jgi:glycosyltransferase involved in cell wall biosynthesis
LKRILYLTSSRNPIIVAPKIAERELVQGGVLCVLHRLRELGWENRRLGFDPSWNPAAVARAMNAFKPDIVYTYGVTALTPVVARQVLGAWRCPIVHGWEDVYADIWSREAGRGVGWLVHLLERQIIRRSDYVITPSFDLQNRARAWGKQVWRIPNGAPVPRFGPGTRGVAMTGRMNVVYVGDQGKYKHTEDVVSAMARVPREIKLYLVGQPNPDLLKYASENVIFAGPASWEDLWCTLSHADVLVSTADQDCRGTLYHYLRAKKPILAYDGTPNLLFRNRVHALLTRDYAAALLELYTSPDLRRALAENAARDIHVYDWEEIPRQFDQVFREICELYRHGRTDRRQS